MIMVNMLTGRSISYLCLLFPHTYRKFRPPAKVEKVQGGHFFSFVKRMYLYTITSCGTVCNF
jgi:hypothetical protein